MGRPSLYSEELAEAICDAIMDGKSLIEICEAEGMPNRRTVYRWMDESKDFAARCARAREAQAEFMDHLILQVAHNCQESTAKADRVKLAAYQWRAAKLAPTRFGERVTNVHEGGAKPVAVDISALSPREKARRVAFILAKAAREAKAEKDKEKPAGGAG